MIYNKSVENTAIVLIAVTLFLLAIIIGLLTVLVFKMMSQPVPENQNKNEKNDSDEKSESPLAKSEFHPAILERMKDLEKLKKKRAEYSCANHPDQPGEVSCAICDLLYCKLCVKPFKSMHLCLEHYPMVMKNEWSEVVTIKTSTHNPEEGVHLYDIKKRLFQDKSIPSYIETHYKIDVDHDNIETYLVLFSLQENLSEIKKELELA